MVRTAETNDCLECGEPLLLLQPNCRDCETAHDWVYEAPCHSCGEQADYTETACPACGADLPIWRALEADVLSSGEPLLVWKESVPRPTDADYRVHLGSIHGQWVDYRRSLGDDGDLHVRSYPRRYELHHDEVSAIDSPGWHLLRHGPAAMTETSVDALSRIGDALSRSGRLAGDAVRSSRSLLTDGEKKPNRPSE